MQDYAEASSETSRIKKTWLSLSQTAKLFALMVDRSDVTDKPGAFLRFHDLWMKSYVFELPCGYLRFEVYPIHKAATLHGIFHSNPFYHTNLIIDVLDYFLEHDHRVERLECHLPRTLRGVNKLASKLAKSSQIDGDKTIYHYWSAQ